MRESRFYTMRSADHIRRFVGGLEFTGKELESLHLGRNYANHFINHGDNSGIDTIEAMLNLKGYTLEVRKK